MAADEPKSTLQQAREKAARRQLKHYGPTENAIIPGILGAIGALLFGFLAPLGARSAAEVVVAGEVTVFKVSNRAQNTNRQHTQTIAEFNNPNAKDNNVDKYRPNGKVPVATKISGLIAQGNR